MGNPGSATAQALDTIQADMSNSNLIDIWRVMHPDTQRFTWHRLRPWPVHVRLDNFLILELIINQ